MYVENDIGLVRLETPVEYNENIKPACLPKSDQNSYIGYSAVVTGWGTTKFSMYPKTLQAIRNTLVHREIQKGPNFLPTKVLGKTFGSNKIGEI